MRTAILLWAAVFAVFALQMFHLGPQVLTTWGGDFFGAMAMYVTLRADRSIAKWLGRRPSAIGSAVFILAGCIAWEILQLSPKSTGRYDLLDIVAYVAGVAAGIVVGRGER